MIDLLHPQYVYDHFPGHHLPPLWQAKRVPREADEIEKVYPGAQTISSKKQKMCKAVKGAELASPVTMLGGLGGHELVRRKPVDMFARLSMS